MIFLTLLPIIEVPIEAWFEIKRKVSVGHWWTALLRGLLMVLIGFILMWHGSTVYWWQGTALSFAVTTAVFNYLYNLFTGRKLLYLRTKGTDALLALLPFWGRWMFELWLLGCGLYIYFKPELVCCNWF